QQKDSLKFNNRKYKYEVGIDMQGFFGGNPGTGLVLKVRNDRGKFVPVSYAKNYRYQISFFGDLNSKANVTELDTFTNYSIEPKASNRFYVQAMVGMEKVVFFRKFNLYYGLDFGPHYDYYHTDYTIEKQIVGGQEVVSVSGVGRMTEWQQVGASIVPFIGVKYRISDRFSVSAETAFFVKYAYISETWYGTDATGFDDVYASRVKYHNITTGMDYLRFLTFNYHFG
ncbi:MAG: hypothetical protein IT270_10550, partial [Saprospiraceae bacterium]|nr:hypothetical protein [Saprospiraceae bacterium]